MLNPNEPPDVVTDVSSGEANPLLLPAPRADRGRCAKITRGITGSVCLSGLFAGLGAATGFIGSVIYGEDGYGTLCVTKYGAVGSAILAFPLMVSSACLLLNNNRASETMRRTGALSLMCICHLAASMGGSALGAAILPAEATCALTAAEAFSCSSAGSIVLNGCLAIYGCCKK